MEYIDEIITMFDISFVDNANDNNRVLGLTKKCTELKNNVLEKQIHSLNQVASAHFTQIKYFKTILQIPNFDILVHQK